MCVLDRTVKLCVLDQTVQMNIYRPHCKHVCIRPHCKNVYLRPDTVKMNIYRPHCKHVLLYSIPLWFRSTGIYLQLYTCMNMVLSLYAPSRRGSRWLARCQASDPCRLVTCARRPSSAASTWDSGTRVRSACFSGLFFLKWQIVFFNRMKLSAVREKGSFRH